MQSGIKLAIATNRDYIEWHISALYSYYLFHSAGACKSVDVI